MLSRRFMVGTVSALMLCASSARAEGTPYCRKVEERAAADASLLFAPQLQLQGVRFPQNGTIDTGVTTGKDYQFRAGISLSPIDIWKGFKVQDVAKADCNAHESTASAAQVLAQGADYGRLPALKKQAAQLETMRTQWEAIVKQADDRFEAHITSLLEVNEVRTRGAELAKKLEQVKGEVQSLEAKGYDTKSAPKLAAMMDEVEKHSMDFEEKAVSVRSLDAWDVKLTGGIIPQQQPVDWYGVVSISFNFGTFSHNSHDANYLEARREELKTAKYELRDQVKRFGEQLKANRTSTQKQLDIATKQASTLEAAKSALGKSDAQNAPHALAVVELELMFIETDKVFLEALGTELARVEDK